MTPYRQDFNAQDVCNICNVFTPLQQEQYVTLSWGQVESLRLSHQTPPLSTVAPEWKTYLDRSGIGGEETTNDERATHVPTIVKRLCSSVFLLGPLAEPAAPYTHYRCVLSIELRRVP